MGVESLNSEGGRTRDRQKESGPLVADDGSSLGSSRSGVNSRVLSDGVGSSVVLALSSEHTLLDSGVGCDIRVVGISGSGTMVRGVVVGVNLLSVGVVDGVGSVGVLAGLKLESG